MFVFVFVVGIGEGVFVCGREWAVCCVGGWDRAVVGGGFGFVFMVEICEVCQSGQARNSEGRVEKKMDD